MNEIELLRKYEAGQRDFSGVDLRGADLRGTDLTGANLSGADLTGAELRSAKLSGADLTRANLRGANLCKASLHNADLSNADLTRANLTGADLRGADIDYSVWPLWCGSKHAVVDRRIAAQLAAHFCALICDDPDYQAAREALLPFARNSHRARDLGLWR